MSEFKFSCPRCDQHIGYDESHFGSQINCPTCSVPITVPVPEAQPSPEPAGLGGLRIAQSASAQTTPREPAPRFVPQNIYSAPRPRGKSWLTTFLFAFFLGGLGVDRFYNGRTGLGIAKALTGGLWGVWSFIDVLLLLTKKYQDAQGNYLEPAKRSHMVAALAVVGASIILGIVVVATAVNGVKSELARLANASGPAETFARFQTAVRANDYSAAFEQMTPEHQTQLLSGSIGLIELKKMTDRQSLSQRGTTRPPDLNAARRQVDATEMKVASIYRKHGISVNPSQFEATIAQVGNKGQCYQDLMEVFPDLSMKNLADAELTGLTINNDTASASVDGEAVKFERVGNVWLLASSEEE